MKANPPKRLGRPPGKTYVSMHAMLLPRQIKALARWAKLNGTTRANAIREAVDKLCK